MLVGLAVLLSRFVADDGSATLYAEDVRQQAEDIAQLVPTFQALITELGSTDRVLLDETIQEIDDTLVRAEAFVDDTVAPTEANDVPVVLDVAIASWRAGLERFRSSVFKAADEVFPTPVESELIDAFADLRAGDRLYANLVTRLAGADIPPPVSPLPVVEFFPPTFPMAGTATTLVAFARGEDSPLKLRAILGIEQVTTEPAWIVDVQDALVLETTSTLVVKVVVANTGNVESVATTVGLELASLDGTVQGQVLDVPPLAPQSTTTLTTEVLEVAPDGLYQLLVGLPLADPAITDPAFGRSFEFRINEQISTTTTSADG